MMKTEQSLLVVAALILVVGVQTGLTTTNECFVCNSAPQYEGADCEDPFNVTRARELGFYQTCDEFNNEFGYNFTHCRKMTQKVGNEYRLLRQCASHVRMDRNCIERTGTKDIKLKYCDCSGKGCNSAPTMFGINLVLLFTVSSLLALLFHS